MKIKSLQISNVLSFKWHQDVGSAERITFDDGLNIIIGENGSGKSTALEVINFAFKRVLYKQYNFSEEIYSQRTSLTVDARRRVIQPANSNSLDGFRLEPNWDTESQPQVIRVEILIDEIDRTNIENLVANMVTLNQFVSPYTTRGQTQAGTYSPTYTLDITLQRADRTFTVTRSTGATDFGYEYLCDYHFYREAIAMYNRAHSGAPLPPLHESFTLISGYRNYNSFQPSISLTTQHPSQQMQEIRNREFSRSLNSTDTAEPTVFGLVRLRVAEEHFGLISGTRDEAACEREANNLPFVLAINKRLSVVNLECKVRLLDMRTWQYRFEFFDLRTGRVLTDINSLSAGQKAILHLVFEAYGRGELKGGLVIIDEPELHLHYQFQNEYVQVIRDLHKEQSCQYILVTHSEALINSSTIHCVRRFSLKDGSTQVKSPLLSVSEKNLIRILDNTRSTYAFFAKKVVLVEGYSDRYFYRAVLQSQYPALDQEIAILPMGGKLEYEAWKQLFESFGLEVYYIADFDFIIERCYPSEPRIRLRDSTAVAAFKASHPDWETQLEGQRARSIFILKDGTLEVYLNVPKDVSEVVQFCNGGDLEAFLANTTNPGSADIQEIFKMIIK